MSSLKGKQNPQPRSHKPSIRPENYSRCLLSCKISKYSFIHDTRPTPNGLSNSPVDVFDWFHITDRALKFRIYKLLEDRTTKNQRNEVIIPPLAIMISTSAEIYENINIPKISKDVAQVVQGPVISCVARRPVLGFRYLQLGISGMMTYRFQIKLDPVDNFERTISLLQRLGVVMSVLPEKVPKRLSNSGTQSNNSSQHCVQSNQEEASKSQSLLPGQLNAQGCSQYLIQTQNPVEENKQEFEESQTQLATQLPLAEYSQKSMLIERSSAPFTDLSHPISSNSVIDNGNVHSSKALLQSKPIINIPMPAKDEAKHENSSNTRSLAPDSILLRPAIQNQEEIISTSASKIESSISMPTPPHAAPMHIAREYFTGSSYFPSNRRGELSGFSQKDFRGAVLSSTRTNTSNANEQARRPISPLRATETESFIGDGTQPLRQNQEITRVEVDPSQAERQASFSTLHNQSHSQVLSQLSQANFSTFSSSGQIISDLQEPIITGVFDRTLDSSFDGDFLEMKHNFVDMDATLVSEPSLIDNQQSQPNLHLLSKLNGIHVITNKEELESHPSSSFLPEDINRTGVQREALALLRNHSYISDTHDLQGQRYQDANDVPMYQRQADSVRQIILEGARERSGPARDRLIRLLTNALEDPGFAETCRVMDTVFKQLREDK